MPWAGNGIWIGDPSRGTLTRLTTGGSTLTDLTWTRDSRQVTYRRARGGGLFSRLVDLSGPEEPLLSGARIPPDDSAGEWSPDGQTLIFSGQDEAGRTVFDLWMMTHQRGTMQLRPLVRTTPTSSGSSSTGSPTCWNTRSPRHSARRSRGLLTPRPPTSSPASSSPLRSARPQCWRAI